MGEARVRFDRATSAAESAGDPVLFAEAALGLGGHWLDEHRAPVDRARVLGLQRAALAGLRASHEALRCRLTARLAAEDVYDGAPIEPVHDALAAARRSRDLGALAEALSLCHHALLTPEFARTRLDLADELVRVAAEGGHGVLGLMGLCWGPSTCSCWERTGPRGCSRTSGPGPTHWSARTSSTSSTCSTSCC